MPDDNDTTDDLTESLRALVAIERDRLLGYHTDELHMEPQRAIEHALAALDDAGDRTTDELVTEETADILGIERP